MKLAVAGPPRAEKAPQNRADRRDSPLVPRAELRRRDKR